MNSFDIFFLAFKTSFQVLSNLFNQKQEIIIINFLNFNFCYTYLQKQNIDFFTREFDLTIGT